MVNDEAAENHCLDLINIRSYIITTEVQAKIGLNNPISNAGHESLSILKLFTI